MVRLSYMYLVCVVVGLFAILSPILSDSDSNDFDIEDYDEIDRKSNAPVEPQTPAGFTEEQEKTVQGSKQTFEFQAEVHRLMDIIINSLYRNKEIFLRELISNASDALDKIRFLSVKNADVLAGNSELEIRISFDKERRTVTLRDTGIGMTRAELINNLGTVARSGTTSFLESMRESENLSLIGQFGVGFYSVYLVSDRVRVVSKHNDDTQHIWDSTADGTFTISPDPRGDTLGRGTEITLWLKEDANEFVNQEKLSGLIKKYSEFIIFPIHLQKSKEVSEEVPIADDADPYAEVEDQTDVIDVDGDGEEVEPEIKYDAGEGTRTKVERSTVQYWEQQNTNKAIWTRDRDEITEEEYNNFYKSISKDPFDENPQTHIHFKAEGEVDFKSILYVPHTAPYNFYDSFQEKAPGLTLYVRRVMITEDFENLIPKYMNFVRGVVDSDDLPLNVSREQLQQNKILRIMAKKLVRKVLEMLKKLSDQDWTPKEKGEVSEEEDEEEDVHPYIHFWNQFGKSLKLGIIDDTSNRSKLAKLLRFKSSTSGDEFTSMEAYMERKKDWQRAIYYIAGENLDGCKSSPFLEKVRAKGIEVFYLTDPIDEYVFQHLAEYDGYKLMSVAKEGLEFGDEDESLVKKREKAYKDMYKPLTKFYKKLLGERVSKVTISSRLVESPLVVVTSQYGHSANMERILRHQTFSDPEKLKNLVSTKTVELNPRHPIMAKLLDMVEEDDESIATQDYAWLLYDTALLNSGFGQDEVGEYTARMNRVMRGSMKIVSNDLLPEIEVEEDEEGMEGEGNSNGGSEEEWGQDDL